jgi:hypothetical protein
MSLREDLGKAREAATLYDVHGVMPTWAKMAMVDFLRYHGQALLEAVRLVESVPRKQTVDDYGSGSDEQNMDLDDMMHMRGWNDCIDEIDAARSKTVDGGGVLEGIQKHRGNPENPPST